MITSHGLRIDTESCARLAGYLPADLERYVQRNNLMNLTYKFVAAMWAVQVFLCILYAVTVGGWFMFVYGLPLTALFIRYCNKAIIACDRAREMRLYADLLRESRR